MYNKTRKNILILCHHYATNFIDVCNQYSHLFPADRYQVTIAYLCGAPDAAARERTQAAEVIFFDESRKNVRGLKLGSLLRLRKLCREKRFSLVVCHRWKPGYLMLLMARLMPVPALFIVMHELNTFKNIARRILVSLFLRKNMLLAGVSNAVRDNIRQSLRGFIAPQRVITLYNCIDIAAVQEYLAERSVARDFLQLPQDAFVFGTLGRLHPVKDQLTMLRAFAASQLEMPHAMLVIMGEGEMERPLKQAARDLKIADRVIFKGFVPEGYRYMRAFDVFLLTSTREAFGRVLPEAMLAKVPAIGTRTHGIPEVIGDAGVIIAPRDDQALARAMRMFYQMPLAEKAQWGERAYAHIENNFSYDCFRQTFFALPIVQAALNCVPQEKMQ